jgi:4-hydroxy-2-oxoheptanedioate aldolase
MRALPDLRHPSRPALGVCLSLLCPELVEMCGLLGFQWVLLDAEHTPLDHAACRNLVRAADVVGLPCIVRVAENRPSIVEGFLDSGALGIMAPHVTSAAEAQALVAAVKFSPEGTRGAASRTRAAGYGLTGSKADFYRNANATTLTVALIEDRRGIDVLDEIMNVPGLDYLAIGANDLRLSMGTATPADDPAFRALLSGARDRIRSHGKPQVAVVSDAAEANVAISAGARLIAISDAVLLAGAARTFLSQVTNHVTSGAAS